MFDITYVFKNKRSYQKIGKNEFAKEHFYNLLNFINSKSVKVIEFKKDDKNKNFLKIIEHQLSKFLSLPFYFSKILTISNFRILNNSKNIILINESVACSLLPFLIYFRLFRKVNILFFTMGLYSKSLNFQALKIFHQFIIKLILFSVDKICFLGIGEYEKAIEFHGNNDKIVYFPFCIDTDFWKSKHDYNFENNNGIIFIGNDSNRDSNTLINIANELKHIDFIFISSLKELADLKLNNVISIKGEWGSEYLSDIELKNIFSKARLCILPLKESSQPSGQSVALQAMSLGIPVVVSKTSGFWDRDNFINENNIIFIESKESKEWTKKINEFYNNEQFLNKISNNSKNTINENFNLNIFDKKIREYLI